MRRRTHQRRGGGREPVRPTTSRVLNALFSMLGPDGARGLRFLDLYAGLGSFGLEALRRGAARVVMVEQNRRRAEALETAIAGSERAAVVAQDAIRALASVEGPFDVVFADPPYADSPFEALATRLDERSLVAGGGVVMFEHFHKSQPPDRLQGLEIATRRRYGDSAVSVYRPVDEIGPATTGEEPDQSW